MTGVQTCALPISKIAGFRQANYGSCASSGSSWEATHQSSKGIQAIHVCNQGQQPSHKQRGQHSFDSAQSRKDEGGFELRAEKRHARCRSDCREAARNGMAGSFQTQIQSIQEDLFKDVLTRIQ